MEVIETTYFYEMLSPSQALPARTPANTPALHRAHVPCPALNRFLYGAVGCRWWWVDRLPWSEERWLEEITRPGSETWVAWIAGNPCGYFELERTDASNTRIAYFGLLPEFVGKGLGGWLLTRCIERAWATSPPKVVVNTSSLDHANARANYEARGFRLVRQSDAKKQLPDRQTNPWGVPAGA